jgi:hypothetical protein
VGAVVNNDAAMIHAIHGEPVKVATDAGLALARQALRAQREAIVAMEKRAAEAAASHDADSPSDGREVFRGDPNRERANGRPTPRRAMSAKIITSQRRAVMRRNRTHR